VWRREVTAAAAQRSTRRHPSSASFLPFGCLLIGGGATQIFGRDGNEWQTHAVTPYYFCVNICDSQQ